jgi:YHS domain-containing protein
MQDMRDSTTALLHQQLGIVTGGQFFFQQRRRNQRTHCANAGIVNTGGVNRLKVDRHGGGYFQCSSSAKIQSKKKALALCQCFLENLLMIIAASGLYYFASCRVSSAFRPSIDWVFPFIFDR